jgi:hypothetical protein
VIDTQFNPTLRSFAMFRLFLHTRIAGFGTNATIRGGEFMNTEHTKLGEARDTAEGILMLDPSVGRITIHNNGQVVETIVR